MSDEISDELFINLQSDPVSLRYLRERRSVPLEITSLHETTADWVWWFTRDIEASLAAISEEMPDLSIKVIFREGHRFSASADIFEGHGIICFDQAVVIMVSNIFQGLLCNENPLTISVPSNEHDVRFALPHGDIRPALFMLGEAPSYITDERFSLAVTLSSMCLKFIFLHEFAHIRNGHVDLLKSFLPMASIEETAGRDQGGLSSLDHRTLEWDADRVAYLLATDFGLNRLLGGPYPEFPTEVRKDAFLKLHVGYYILFRLLQEIEGASTSYELRYHPLPADRLLLLAAKAQAVAAHMGFELSTEEIGQTIRIGENVWESAFLDPDQARIAYVTDSHEIIAMLNNWNLLRPHLVPLNRGTTELAPPFPDS